MLNKKGTYLALTVPHLNDPDGKKLPPLVIPDGRGPWALRYLWVQHKTRNEEFISNYFNNGNNEKGSGLNLRKQTQHLKDSWDPHNKIFEESRDNGNLIWRVKVYNSYANSIDYVEIWRSREIIKQTFGARIESDNDLKDRPNSIEVLETPGNLSRTVKEIYNLRKGLDESGFEIRIWDNFPKVHPLLTMNWYHHFVGRFKLKDQCVINTPFNMELNPLDPFLMFNN